MKRTTLLVTAAAFLAVLLLGVLTSARGKDGFDTAATRIVIRQVGHEVLRQAGDSSSALPPVQEPEPGRYLLSFSRSFPFSPDSLVAVINKVLAAGLPGTDYVVNVIERPSQSVVYGYAVLRSKKEEVVPCLGRTQPSGLYDISIRLREAPFWSTGRIAAVGVGLLTLGLIFVRFRARKSPVPPSDIVGQEPPPPASEDGIRIGRYLFVPAQQCLFVNGEQIALTGKESALLQLFAASPNVVIDRQQLQKLWEDEGVIVGRSLDVFVSRLRKKLEKDPALAIVNIHGKGYKLDVPSAG